VNGLDPRPTDETIRLQILKKLKSHKAEFQDEQARGLYPSELEVSGLNENNPYHRQAKTDVLVSMVEEGLVVRDQVKDRTVGFRITARGEKLTTNKG
jgi:hypothetical protein